MGKHLDLDDVCSGHPEAAKELAELRKDAARINWIERQTLDELSMGVLQDCEDDGDYFVSGDKHFGNGPTLRAAIDAAIAKDQP